MELIGLPFLIAVKPPSGASTIQEALPEGFEERMKGRGVVWGGWVQNPLILSHLCRMFCEPLQFWVNVGVSGK